MFWAIIFSINTFPFFGINAFAGGLDDYETVYQDEISHPKIDTGQKTTTAKPHAIISNDATSDSTTQNTSIYRANENQDVTVNERPPNTQATSPQNIINSQESTLQNNNTGESNNNNQNNYYSIFQFVINGDWNWNWDWDTELIFGEKTFNKENVDSDNSGKANIIQSIYDTLSNCTIPVIFYSVCSFLAEKKPKLKFIVSLMEYLEKGFLPK